MRRRAKHARTGNLADLICQHGSVITPAPQTHTHTIHLPVDYRQGLTNLIRLYNIHNIHPYTNQWMVASTQRLMHLVELLSKATTFSALFVSMWELNPHPFAQLTQCSTTEPQEHVSTHVPLSFWQEIHEQMTELKVQADASSLQLQELGGQLKEKEALIKSLRNTLKESEVGG